MTDFQRELIFGIFGAAILAVVGYVLFTQASEGDPSAPVEGSVGTASSEVVPAINRPVMTPTPESTPTPRPNPQTYTVQQGDTLLSIADRFGITVEDLAAKNDILDPNEILAGQRLELPQPGERVKLADNPAQVGAVYIVQLGDTLYGVSQELDVSVEDLATVNDITEPRQLYVGRRLEVPARRLTPPTPRSTRPG